MADKAYAKREDIGTAITVKFNDTPVCVVVEYDAIQYVDLDQFECSGLDVKDYDVIVVKEGYISDDYNKYGDYCVMSLTQGPTYQKVKVLFLDKSCVHASLMTILNWMKFFLMTRKNG